MHSRTWCMGENRLRKNGVRPTCKVVVCEKIVSNVIQAKKISPKLFKDSIYLVYEKFYFNFSTVQGEVKDYFTNWWYISLPFARRSELRWDILTFDVQHNQKILKILINFSSYTHTERQAARQAARSHWNALWRSKIDPRPIPKRHGERHYVHNTFQWDFAAWRSVWVYLIAIPTQKAKVYPHRASSGSVSGKVPLECKNQTSWILLK